MSFGANWNEVFTRLERRPPPTVYGVAFTPRSGSTWLSDVVRQSRALGSPGEYFNINVAFDSISRSAATSMEHYFYWLTRVRQTNAVFGFEISGPWLRRLRLDGHIDILDQVEHWFFLRRRDYVLQAVSLYLASNSGVFHRREGADDSPAGEPAAAVEFDATAIAEAALQIMNGEVEFARYFRERQIEALPLWYEDMVETSPEVFLGELAEHLGVRFDAQQLANIAAIEPQLRRGGGDRNREYAQRFREERADFVAHWDAHRGRMGAAAWRALQVEQSE